MADFWVILFGIEYSVVDGCAIRAGLFLFKKNLNIIWWTTPTPLSSLLMNHGN